MNVSCLQVGELSVTLASRIMEKEHGGYPARLVSLDQMALWIGSLRKEQQNHFMQQKQPLIRNLMDFLIYFLWKKPKGGPTVLPYIFGRTFWKTKKTNYQKCRQNTFRNLNSLNGSPSTFNGSPRWAPYVRVGELSSSASEIVCHGCTKCKAWLAKSLSSGFYLTVYSI